MIKKKIQIEILEKKIYFKVKILNLILKKRLDIVQERASELKDSVKENFQSIVQGDKRMENMKKRATEARL